MKINIRYKIIFFVVIIIILSALIFWEVKREESYSNGKILDLQIHEIKDGYMLIPMSEIECRLYKKLEGKEIENILQDKEYPTQKIEGEDGTVSSGIGLCIIGGRITQYSDYKNFIAVFERDRRKYLCVDKKKGEIIYSEIRKKDLEKRIREKYSVEKMSWKTIKYEK